MIIDATEYNYGARLYFPYTQADGVRANRYIDLRAWEQGTNDKWWMAGSRARGALWTATKSMYVGYMNDVLLCEGETDALAAVQAGAPFHWIAAIPGANTISEELVDQLAKPWLRITLAFDNDDAGRTARDKIAWWMADRYPLVQLAYEDGLNDLRDVLTKRSHYGWPTVKVEQVPTVRTAPPSPRPTPHLNPKSKREDTEKPDLNRVWDKLSPRSKAERRDAKQRRIRQAWCPLHDDGRKPAAWVGEDRWGCFVCGIESADVYELVGWVRGYATPGQPLTGEAFKQAREEARRLD